MNSQEPSILISHPHQSLEKHLASVDEVSFNALSRKVLSESFFEEADVEVLRQWMVYFHDFGKATAFFQYRIIQAALQDNPALKELNEEYVKTFAKRPDYLDIVTKANEPTWKPHATLGAFVGQDALPENLTPLFRAQLIEVIKRHHGNLKNFGEEEQSTLGNEKMLTGQWAVTNLDDYRKILAPFDYVLPMSIQPLIIAYGEDFVYEVGDELPAKSIKPYLQTLFLFSLLLAGDKGDLMLTDRSLVGQSSGIPSTIIDDYKRNKFSTEYQKPIDEKRENAYQDVQRNLLKNLDHGFYSITLPTGLGKTFTAYNAAIRLRAELMKLHRNNGIESSARIIYCLPFTSVIDQNAQIFEEILTFAELPEGLLAKHHYLADWGDKRDVQDAIGQLSHSEKEYFVEGWEYDITITTFVQLLETVFSNRNRKLRKFHNLANAIVILDEVQNIPPKYFMAVAVLFEEIYRQMGTRFLFVTATQPFLLPKNQVLELTINTEEIFRSMNRIDLDLSRWINGPEEADEQLALFGKEINAAPFQSFLFIYNYVKDSQAAFQYFERHCQSEETVFIYLSAAIVPYERKRRIQEIKDRNNTNQRTIVVSTQVVEAGVDIDLDIVYRAFAPLDSINQSAGRCNRNGKKARGSVRLFKQIKRRNSIYDAILLDITTKVLNQAIEQQFNNYIVPEAKFYSLNESFAQLVREKIALENEASLRIIKAMKKMRFEDVEKEFSLIEQKYVRYGVFIEDPEKLPGSDEVWKAYQAIFRTETDRWERKKQLRQLRARLLEFVVQFPEKCLPAARKEEAETRPFIRMTAEEYPECYNFTFGYFASDQNQVPQNKSLFF